MKTRFKIECSRFGSLVQITTFIDGTSSGGYVLPDPSNQFLMYLIKECKDDYKAKCKK
jgi:hypothetical protein